MSCIVVLSLLLMTDEGNTVPDQSTPRATLKAYAAALETGDLKSLEVLCLTNDVLRDWVTQQAVMMQALKRMSDALAETFGDEGKALQRPSPAADLRKKADELEFEENGERATVAINPKVPMQFARGKDGLWRIDYVATLTGKDLEMEFSAKVFRETSKLISTISDELAADKFATLQDFQIALRTRRRALDTELAKSKPATLP